MSWMSNMPKSTRASEIPTTSGDSYLASVARSSLILSTCARVMSSSDDKSRPKMGRKPCSSFSASITSHTSRSIYCRQRRILCSSNIRLSLVSCFNLEPEARTWAEKSCLAASAQTQLVSHSMNASPSARARR
jgi:hypothetical protein